MIRMWESTETNFKSNRWVLNDCTKSQITEIINGEFALDLEYPLQDTKGLSKYIIRGNIITCPVRDDRPEQQFRIRKVNKTSSKVVVYAESKLIADLKANRVRAMTIIGKTRKQAIQYILDNTLEPNEFIVGNLDTNTTNNVIVNIQEGSALEALIGKSNSILSEYGGEFIINNNVIDIIDSRGSNNGFTIAYGKNISSIKETTDDTDLTTVLIPKVGDLRLPEYYVESPKVNSYEKRYFQDIELNFKIWNGKGEQASDEVTQAEAYTIMRNTCNRMFVEDKLDQINFNYSVDLVTLGKTEEYKEYAILESINLGDTVEIKHKLLNLDLDGRINKTIYDVLLDKYSKLEIGFVKQDITDIINNTIRTIKFTEQSILLKVSNVSNTLYSQIEMTAESITSSVDNKILGVNSKIEQTASQIQSTISDTKNNLQSQITQTATQIRSEVSNADAGLQSKITQTATQIRSEVSNADDDLQSQITQQAGEIQSTVSGLNGAKSQITQLSSQISSKISKGDLSSLIEQNAESVSIAIENKTDMNVVFDSNGQTIKNGALVIEDSDGSNIMSFDDGVAHCSVGSFNELIIHNTEKGSSFYNTLANMPEIYADKFSCDRLFIESRHIYDYIVDVLQDKDLI